MKLTQTQRNRWINDTKVNINKNLPGHKVSTETLQFMIKKGYTVNQAVNEYCRGRVVLEPMHHTFNK